MGLVGRRRGERGQFFFSKCFFHYGVAKEGFTGGYFFLKIHHGTGERVHLEFFSSFFYY
jgi:hypothetical protein